MKAAAFITILLAVSSMAIIPDGSVATAVFRGAPPSQPKARRADPASKKRRHDTSAFDQIIVETLDQPATQRTSATLILFLFSTGLLIGAVLLLLCILCLLRVFRAQITYQPVKQQDVDDHLSIQEAPFTKAILKKTQTVPHTLQTVPHTSELRTLTEAAIPVQYSEESATVKPQRSKKRRTKEKPAKHHRHGHSTHHDEQDNDEDDDMRTTSQLRLDLRIKQDKPRRTTCHLKRYHEVSTDSSDSSEVTDSMVDRQTVDICPKTRPLVFCRSPEGQDKKKTFRYGTKPRDFGSHLEKELDPAKVQDRAVKVAKAPTSFSSHSSGVDENFFGEPKASQLHKATAHGPGKKPKPKPREEPGSSNGLDASQQTVTLDQLKMLLDEMLAKTNDGKSPRNRTPR